MRLKLLLIAVLFFASCDSPVKKLELTIERDKMIALIADLQMVKASVGDYNDFEKDSLSEIYYNQVFQYHKITKEEFDKNYSNLNSVPDSLELYYTLAEDKLKMYKKMYDNAK